MKGLARLRGAPNVGIMHRYPRQQTLLMTPNTALTPRYTAFWSELAPREHFVQIYGGDARLLDALAGFVCGGLEKGEAVMFIATPTQLSALNHRLVARGVDLDSARARQLYLTFDADEALQQFLVRDWPDESLLQHFLHQLVARAQGRRTRVFSSMHSLLLARSQGTAVLRLEHLWHRLCDQHELILFCAYPRGVFPDGTESTRRAICATHSCVIP